MTRSVSEQRQEDLRRCLAEYAQVWRDDEFLDAMCDWAAAGRRFTPAQADAIGESLTWWRRRLNGPSLDPDRPPPGTDPLLWELAIHFRDCMEQQGLPCPSRREIYAELSRIADRDRLRDNPGPWRDRDGKPGWYRRLRDVITAYTAEDDAADSPYRACRDLAQPGTVDAVAAGIIEQEKLRRLAARASTAAPYVPDPRRRAAVRGYLAGRDR